MKSLILLLVLPICWGCASTSRKLSADYRQLVQQGKFSAALEIAESKSFYPDENSRLLKLLEIGTIHFYQGNYYQSLQAFDQAKNLSDQLFTVSISKGALATVANANLNNYYGEVYERSWIRLYQLLNHYQLHQLGKYESFTTKINGSPQVSNEKILTEQEKRLHLSAARAILLEWDSMQTTWLSQLAGKATYKVDLAAKILGAFVHETFGGSDRQIARNLLDEANKVLMKNYFLYPAYNADSAKFRSDYSKLPLMDAQEIESKYVRKTAHTLTLQQYLEQKKDRKNQKIQNNVGLLFMQQQIAVKQAKKIEFPLPLNGPVSLNGDRSLGSFMMNVLKLSNGAGPAISFELPAMLPDSMPEQLEIVIQNEKNQDVVRRILPMITPLSDLGFLEMDNQIIGQTAITGARVAAKYLTAVLAAYATYRQVLKSAGEFAATMAGTAAYLAASKGVAMSEQADLRQWISLPKSLYFADFALPAGNYKIALSRGGELLPLKTLTVENGASKQLTILKI